MTPLIILFAFILLLFFIFLAFHAIRLFRKIKTASADATAKDVYVVTYDKKFPQNRADTSINEQIHIKMDQALMDAMHQHKKAGKPLKFKKRADENRRFPRRDFACIVEFIKKGKLYKETSRDLSFSGIYLNSKTPEKYDIKKIILLTFQMPDGQPQKRKGKIVRKDKTGIGVHFLME